MNLRRAFVIGKAAGKFKGVSLQSIPMIGDNLPATHVKVRMAAARINPVDMDLAAGIPFAKCLNDPLIAGVDGSGTVTQVGSDVRDFKVGDHVFMYRQFTDFGTWAQEISVPASFVALAPSSLSLQQAGAMALIASTAFDSLFNQLKVESGKSILILGAGGGVGFSATQFAVQAGLNVYAYAGSRDFEKLKSAGAKKCIDYRSDELENVIAPKEVDYVFDAAGKASLSKLMGDLQPAKVCSISHPNPETMSGVGVKNLGWFWTTLLRLMAFKNNYSARQHGVELIGQVTPAGAPTLMQDVASKVDSMSTPFQVKIETISLDSIEKAGGITEKDIGKVILFE